MTISSLYQHLFFFYLANWGGGCFLPFFSVGGLCCYSFLLRSYSVYKSAAYISSLFLLLTTTYLLLTFFFLFANSCLHSEVLDLCFFSSSFFIHEQPRWGGGLSPITRDGTTTINPSPPQLLLLFFVFVFVPDVDTGRRRGSIRLLFWCRR
jgi:hypothetical protein